MKNTTKKINLKHILFGGAALASMLGGMIFLDSAIAQEIRPTKIRRRCYRYTLINRTNRGVDFNLGRRKSFLRSKGQFSFRRCFKLRRRVRHPLVKYDEIIGQGYRVASVRLTPGRNAFDRQGRKLVLKTGGTDGPVPQIAPFEE
ncbi:hypothetical protein [Mastigocoleus testarum]|uniref:Uncharacterized protein n=1 Tax=Mastigocoleus testarum BC008 TaxID=371196 RepID=A0A0V7ZK44_9CYAN|nr:hypothetical protein [Mastigocoleus testarum]KST62187.1 hypothetical protein BC008_37720 [Mastigocoleus testarum BC008]KST64817.1 hypothetical protein BC008_18550 [Mastigocoleus testarum BC008]